MTAQPPSISIEQQIEAVEQAAHDYEFSDGMGDDLRAAAATLRDVQACRVRAQQQIADGVTVAADIEGLIP